MFEIHHDNLLCENKSGGISLALYRGREDFARLQEPWHRVVDSLSQKRFFHVYSWYHSYIDSLDKNPNAVFFLVISRGFTPIAVFPLKRSIRNVYGLRLRCLEVPSHPHMSLSDFIFEKTADNAILISLMAKNVRHLTGEAWDMIHVPNTLEDSATAYALERAPVLLSVTTLTSKSNHVNCNLPYEQVAKNFKGHFRRNLRRLHRRTQEWGKLQYHSYASTEDIRRHFTEFLKVEASGWKGEHGTRTAISCDASTLAFYRRVIDEFAASDQCLLNLLTLNERCIAGQLCLRVDGTLYILKIGFDESYAEIAPGNLIMEALIRQCADDDRVQTVSFVTDRDWNYFWGATSTPVYTHAIFNPATLPGWLGYLIYRTKKMVKYFLPATIRTRMAPRCMSRREFTAMHCPTREAGKEQ
jgi:CelD/BcsL family acetyltransferase involved in cellulose biosynthesis